MSERKKHFNFSALLSTVLLLFVVTHTTEGDGSKGKGNRGTKYWIPNMNFDNPDNWDGLGNCGSIYSFGGSPEASVISLPSSVSAKNIILPQNGYVVLQSGRTTFSESTCPMREAIWKRHGAFDWFDPSNWKRGDNVTRQNEAIAHVERVPCQFDSVKFKGNSSFSVLISGDVNIRKFIVGNETLPYVEVGLLMSTEIGRVQFKKKPETKFQVQDTVCDESSSDCICDNYNDVVKRRICSLVNCPAETGEEKCPYPVTPNGFCCPVCGIVLKITHKDGLSLAAVRSKLNTELLDTSDSVDSYVTRYKEGVSHVVLVPRMANRTANIGKVVKNMKAYLVADSEVTDVSVRKSWDSLNDASGPTSGELTGSSVAGVEITLIVLLIIVGVALSIFYWKKSGIPQISSISCPSCPSCPTFPSVRLPSQFLSSTGTSSSSFAFARFSNERISHLNLGPSFEGSSISRTEVVDDFINDGRKSSVAPQVVTAELIGVDEDGANDPEDIAVARAKDLAQDSPFFSQETEHVYDLIEIPGETSNALGAASTGSLVNLLKSEE